MLTLLLMVARVSSLGLSPFSRGLVLAMLWVLMVIRPTGRALGGGIGGAVRFAFAVGLPVLSAAFLLSKLTLQVPWSVASQWLAVSYISVIGIYIMLFGSLGGKSWKGMAWGLPGLLSLMIFTFALAIGGDISAEVAGCFIVGTLLVRLVLGRFCAEGVTRGFFSLLFPLAAVVVSYGLHARGLLPLELFCALLGLSLLLVALAWYLRNLLLRAERQIVVAVIGFLVILAAATVMLPLLSRWG